MRRLPSTIFQLLSLDFHLLTPVFRLRSSDTIWSAFETRYKRAPDSGDSLYYFPTLVFGLPSSNSGLPSPVF